MRRMIPLLSLLLCCLVSTTLSAAEPTLSDPSLHMELETWGERIGFALVGSIIVVGTLVLLWLICELIALPFKKQAALEAQRAKALAAAAQPTAPVAATDSQEAPAIPIAAIAAAVAISLDQRHRVVSIQPHESGQHWARVGRHQHFESHRLR